MKIKTVPITVKAGEDDGLGEGEFVAYASTFTRTPDSYGDVVAKGAFADTLQAWKESGNVLPVLFGHRFDDPDYNLGGVVEAEEDDHGLKIRGKLDLENPKSQQVHRMLKGRRIGEMSFAYDVKDSGTVTLADGTKATELRRLDLYEVSVVPVGANRDTEILAVKDAAGALAKEGSLTEEQLDSLRQAQEAIGAVIAEATQEDEANEDGDEANEEEPSGANSEEPGAKSSVEAVLALIDIKERSA